MKEDNKDKHPYNDIINLDHHVSSNRVHMSVLDRAAQFSPFAALTGFEGAVKETARRTDQRIELDEDAKTILDEKLRIIQEQLSKQEQSSKQEQLGKQEQLSKQEQSSKQEQLNKQEQLSTQQLSAQQEIEIVYFQPDEKKAGGSYISIMGTVKKIESYERTVVMQDGTRILIEEIVSIGG